MPVSRESLQRAMAAAGVKWGIRAEPLHTDGAAGTGLGLSMNVEERIALLAEARSLEHMTFRVVAAPPPAIDWRAIGKKNYVTGIRDQRSCGSCVAHATCAAIEARINIEEDKPGRDLNLSEANLFNCGGGSCANGWNFVPALNYASKSGLGLEKDQPYNPANSVCKPIKKYYKVRSFSAASTTVARKQALSTRGPVIAGFSVFEDFTYYKSGVYRHVAGDFLGYHAVCVVGYSDKNQCWIVKNSWGPSWGEKGYFRIGYGECGMDSQFAFYDVDPVAISSP